MNFRNKYLLNTLRILFGLFMAFSGIAGLMMGDSTEGIPPRMLAELQTMKGNGLLYMIKITEAVAGLMLVFNLLPALAAIFIAPIGVGVIVFNSFIAPELVVSGVIVCLFDAYLGYAYWDKYKALFTKP